MQKGSSFPSKESELKSYITRVLQKPKELYYKSRTTDLVQSNFVLSESDKRPSLTSGFSFVQNPNFSLGSANAEEDNIGAPSTTSNDEKKDTPGSGLFSYIQWLFTSCV